MLAYNIISYYLVFLEGQEVVNMADSLSGGKAYFEHVCS